MSTNPNRAAAVQPLAWGDVIDIGGVSVAVEPASWCPDGIVEGNGVYFEQGRWGPTPKCEPNAPYYTNLLQSSVPLLPPPAALPAGPEYTLAALALLPGARDADGNGKAFGWVDLCFETVVLRFHRQSLFNYRVVERADAAPNDNYDARGRDHAREGVLRQWITQRAAIQEGVEQ